MILKRYGATLQSVEPHFDARAINEIGFQRSHQLSLSADEFSAGYELIELHELAAEAEGMVQIDAQQEALERLHDQLLRLEHKHQGLILVLENEAGRDYPRLHENVTNIIVAGQNKLHFHRHVEPPLRMGVYAPRQR